LDALNKQYELGKIDEVTFMEGFQKHIPNADLISIRSAWNSILADFPLYRLEFLQMIASKYRLFLLSNTNSIHEAAFTQSLQQTHGIPSIALYFDKAYLSHRLGLRKPDPKAFQYILDTHGLSPAATLFIDDSVQHIEAAQSLCIQTIHLSNGMTIEKDIFKPLI
jgi:putative hydrolase of the HAD superfamily